MNAEQRSRSLSAEDTMRWSKILLLASIAIFFTLVVFNNITDFDSNYQFVHHVLAMDATFPGNHGLWRALHPTIIHLIFYVSIIVWETLNMVVLWFSVWALAKVRGKSIDEFNEAKRYGVIALTAGLLLWMVAFLCIGGEYFLMWQSKVWNGQEAAFRMFAVEALCLILLMLPESPKQLNN